MVAVALIARMCPIEGKARRGLAVFAFWLVGLITREAAPHSSAFHNNLWFRMVFSVNIDDGTVRGVNR